MHRFLLALALLIAPAAQAQPPRVIADIVPVQSLVAMVMGDIATPDLLLPANASPHSHSLRPSEAAALARADLVIWIGPELTPWLSATVERLAARAQVLTLTDAAGTIRLPVRARPDLSGVVAGRTDPHLWLDPENAMAWLDVIAAALSRIDPDNADAYGANARTGRAAIARARDDAAATLAPVRARAILLDHDWFQYFERRFELNVIGALADSEAARPGPARLLALARAVRDSRDGICILAEPPVNMAMFRPVLDSRAPAVAMADPIGASLTPGPGLYPTLIRVLAQAIASCAPGQ